MSANGKLLLNPLLASEIVAKCIKGNFANKYSHRSTTDCHIDQQTANYLTH